MENKFTGGQGMTEWINGWKNISKYLGESQRSSQIKAKKKIIPVYKFGGSVRADAKELDKHIKSNPIA